jgi:DNA-binding response OmpR family regulator
MPQMGGLDLAERLRGMRPRLRTLFTSGYSEDAAAQLGEVEDAKFLQKPFTGSVLARRVREVLAIAQRLEAGENPQQIKPTLKGNPWALDRRIAEARRSDVGRLSRTIEVLADLELASRGASELSDPTEAIRALTRIAA